MSRVETFDMLLLLTSYYVMIHGMCIVYYLSERNRKKNILGQQEVQKLVIAPLDLGRNTTQCATMMVEKSASAAAAVTLSPSSATAIKNYFKSFQAALLSKTFNEIFH